MPFFKMAISKGKYWIWTDYYKQQVEFEFDPAVVVSAIWQVELGKKNQKPHVQGFLELSARKTLSAVKKILHNSVHAEICRDTDQAALYCQKEEGRVSGPFFFGQYNPRSVSYNIYDINSCKDYLIQYLKDNKHQDYDDFVINNLEIFQKYKEKLFKIIHRKHRAEMINQRKQNPKKSRVWVLFGDSGLGKTTIASTLINKLGKNFFTYSGSKFFLGYDGEKVMLIDEAAPRTINVQRLNKIIDGFDRYQEIKGSFIEIDFEEIFILSNYSPDALLGKANNIIRKSFMRRITFLGEFRVEPDGLCCVRFQVRDTDQDQLLEELIYRFKPESAFSEALKIAEELYAKLV